MKTGIPGIPPIKEMGVWRQQNPRRKCPWYRVSTGRRRRFQFKGWSADFLVVRLEGAGSGLPVKDRVACKAKRRGMGTVEQVQPGTTGLVYRLRAKQARCAETPEEAWSIRV